MVGTSNPFHIVILFLDKTNLLNGVTNNQINGEESTLLKGNNRMVNPIKATMDNLAKETMVSPMGKTNPSTKQLAQTSFTETKCQDIILDNSMVLTLMETIAQTTEITEEEVRNGVRCK